MAIGFSVPTPDEGITSDVVVVDSLKSMIDTLDSVKGKIVVVSRMPPFGMNGLLNAGASAILVRSSTPLSLNTLHTSIFFYDEKIRKAPIGLLTHEDVELITRMSKRGTPLRMFLKLQVLSNGTSTSQNLMGDLKGVENPNEVIVISAHIDSWDVGQGAVDDGVGLFLALNSLNLYNKLGLRPRRTMRAIFWTGEEMGLYGARAWLPKHMSELGDYIKAGLESDYGCFRAMGYIFSGVPEVGCILNEIRNLVSPYHNLPSLTKIRFMPTDVSVMNTGGVPTVVLNGNDGRYFWYHHTEADVLTSMNPMEVDNCLGVWASTAFIIADMQTDLPNGN